MSFDIDPKDQYQRFLLWHPESECLFTVYSEAERNSIIDSEPCVSDVTGIPEHEDSFLENQLKELKRANRQ